MPALPVEGSAPARRRFRVGLALVVALALVQTLGLLHRIVHVGAADGGPPGLSAPAWRAAPGGSALLQALFAAHEDDRDCAVFDHISHADLAVAAEPVRAAAAPLPVLSQAHAAWHVAAQARGFLARAPPLAS